MSDLKPIKLTSSEIASLWQEYISHTHSLCMLDYLIATTQDEEILSVLKEVKALVGVTLEETQSMLNKEQLSIPSGFTSDDVNTKAAKLFPDSFSLSYIKNLSRVMASACGLMVTMSTRADIRTHFETCTVRAFKAFSLVSDVLLKKGLYVRPPFIQPEQTNEYVSGKEYLDGRRLIGEVRPLNAIEISHVFANIEANQTGIILTKAYGQTTSYNEVKEFMNSAQKAGKEFINNLTDLLTSSDLPAPMPSDMHVNPSTERSFSDKYMVYGIITMMGAGISDYATSLAASMRSDIKTTYSDLLTKTSKLARKGSDIMITNHWLEQPPGPANVNNNKS